MFACGYHLGQGETILRGRTFSIPYIQGDFDGELTAEVIKAVTSSSNLIYQNSCGELVLKINIIDYDEENIGFRYDRTKHDKIKKSIIPVETRATLSAELELYEDYGSKVLIGPVIINASMDFDHDYYSSRHGVNIFSLGQLIDIDSAVEAARRPLNKELARKIADFLINVW